MLLVLCIGDHDCQFLEKGKVYLAENRKGDDTQFFIRFEVPGAPGFPIGRYRTRFKVLSCKVAEVLWDGGSK